MEENTAAVNEIGTVKIASDVVGTIAVMVAQEVEGIFSMSGGFTDDIAEKFGMKSSNKGIKVQVGETEAAIDLYLIVDYGVKIPEVCLNAQERVKNAVETMTGLKVVEINIHVQGINSPKEQKTEEDANSKVK